jgi:hypothetical protein
MRRLLFVALLLAAAGAAEAQVIWLTAGAGTTFEINPATEPDETWLHYGDVVPSLSLGLSVNEDLHVRLRAAELPYDVAYGGEAWPARVGAVTVGADYFFKGVLGRAVITGGLGWYDLNLKAQTPPAGVEEGNFGWYVGMGEWFEVTHRVKGVIELILDNPGSEDNPMLLTATVGVAVTF